MQKDERVTVEAGRHAGHSATVQGMFKTAAPGNSITATVTCSCGDVIRLPYDRDLKEAMETVP